MERRESVTGIAVDGKQACISLHGAFDEGIVLERLTRLLESRLLEGDLVAHTVDRIAQSDRDEENVPRNDSRKYRDSIMFVRCREEYGAQEALDCLHSIDGVIGSSIDCDVAKVSLIGRGLTGNGSVISRILACLRLNGIYPKHIACSDLKISCFVTLAQAEAACRSIHAEFALCLPQPSLALTARTLAPTA